MVKTSGIHSLMQGNGLQCPFGGWRIGRVIIGTDVNGIEAVVEGFNHCSWDRSELVEPLKTSDSVASG